jgi:hypothetical protein
MSHWPFRVTMTVAAVLLFDQAIFAGRMLSGSFPALHTHRENATYAGIAVLVAAVCAIPSGGGDAGRSGRCSPGWGCSR